MLNTLIANAEIAITNAEQDMPQYAARYAEMRADLVKVQHPKLVQYILQDLMALYEEVA